MPNPQQTAIVQKMIDSGESEANIASVIQHFAKQGRSDVMPVSADEPDTFRGGFVKSLGDQARQGVSDLAHGTLNALPGIGAVVGGALSAPETGGVGTIPGMALGAGIGKGARDLIGHATGLDAPTTPLQKAGGIAAETAATGATAAILPGLVAAAKAPIQTLREGAEQFGSAMPPAIRRLGKLFPALPKGPSVTAMVDLPSAAVDVAPEVAVPALEPITTRNGEKFPPAIEAKIRAKLGELSPVGQARPPIQVTPESAMQPDRVDLGAEKVGRANGMTTQQVREATGPIRGEAQGQAAGMPVKPMDRIVQKLIDMGPKGQGLPEADREAYAARGTSDKTRVQVQAYLDALRKVGFAVPGALSMRDLMVRGIGGNEKQE